MRKASRTVTARIHRLIGQMHAIEEMVANRRNCVEILHQIAAVRSGIETVGQLIFQRELERMRASRRLGPEEIARLTKVFIKTN